MYIENQANSSRREFLRTAAAAGAMVSLPGLKPPAARADKSRVQTCYFSKHLQ